VLKWLEEFGLNLWSVLCELSPWFLFGALVAGLLHGLTPSGFVRRRLNGYVGVLLSVLVGIPLPLCSCAVIPTGIGLKRNGASDGACIGFLISTPQTGIDSVFVTAAFLGWPFAIYKVFVALILGTSAGFFIERLTGKPTTLSQDHSTSGKDGKATVPSTSCCFSGSILESPKCQPDITDAAAHSCCTNLAAQVADDAQEPAVIPAKTVVAKPTMRPLQVIQPAPDAAAWVSISEATTHPVIAYFQTSVGQSLEIIRSIYRWVVLGVVVSALISTLLPLGSLNRWLGNSDWFQSPVALLISIPLYVCATASVPIAAALVGSGLSVGASIVFLMAGPATNVATIGAIYRSFSRTAFWVYMLTVIFGSIIAAFIFDRFFSTITGELFTHSHSHLNLVGQLSAVALLSLFAWFFANEKKK